MKIGIIDCDLLSKPRHNFPNLALMKLSGYHKSKGDTVELVNYDAANPYALFKEHDYFYAAKVFSDTNTPQFIKDSENMKVGGSGFYYDHEHELPNEIEHFFPDYSLYKEIRNNEYYNDFSIGFITRGCFRKCSFCINQNYDRVNFHSHVDEFLDKQKKYIMLLDDNITGYSGFYDVFDELDNTGKPYIFKQGMDFRLLSLKKMKRIWDSNYYSGDKKSKGGRTFFYAFDSINDYDIIETKLKIYYENIQYRHNIIFYVLAGYDENGIYDNIFYENDIMNTLRRIELLFKYGAFAYVMLHKNYIRYYNNLIYNQLKNICNAPINVAGKVFGDAILQKGYNQLYEYIQNNMPEINKIKQNIKHTDLI